MNDQNIGISNIGKAVERRIIDELGAVPDPEFDDLNELKNLAGENTGYINVYKADRLVKVSSLSISFGPGRYFNIHAIPEPRFDIPRYVLEGMLMPQGSQVSMDLFPDMDVTSNIKHLMELYREAAEVYDQARQDPDILLEPSKQFHMRGFGSPVFLCTFGAPESAMPALERYGHGYFDAWLKIYRSASELPEEQAADRAARRMHMSRTLIELDPDRGRVVQIYGEETTKKIEAANML